jgi:hypothetical protein
VDHDHIEEATKIAKRPPIDADNVSRTIYVDESVADVGVYVTWLHE